MKLYGNSDKQLTGLINTVKNVSEDIKIEVGLERHHSRGARSCQLRKSH